MVVWSAGYKTETPALPAPLPGEFIGRVLAVEPAPFAGSNGNQDEMVGALFFAQGLHRIDGGGAQGRLAGGRERDQEQQ